VRSLTRVLLVLQQPRPAHRPARASSYRFCKPCCSDLCRHARQLLSAVFEREYNLDTLSWSLQRFPELNYVELPRAPTPAELAAVQQRCNDLIAEARNVHVRFELATKETGVELGEKVPDDYKADESGEQRPPVQRTVTIDGIDENRACRTFVSNCSPRARR